MSDLYKSLGASATKSGLHQALERAGAVYNQEYFSNLLPDISGDKDFLSFLHCDGAGTKSIVAYLLYKETGNYQYFSGLAQDALVMNLDDVYCVGEPENIVLANTIQRNARLIDDNVLEVLITSYKDLCSKLNALGIPIILGGGETADCGDVVRTLIVDAVVAGRILKRNTISTKNIVPGDIIVGLSNTGRSTYEAEENSSIGSNGLTLARHAILNSFHKQQYPEVIDPEIDHSLSYSGKYKVTDRLPYGPVAGEALLSPTRTYAPVLAKVYKSLGSDVHAVIHNTGGGQTKVLRFGSGLRYVKDDLFPIPPLFSEIQKCRGISWSEMYQVFNMGHRIELYVPENSLKIVQNIANVFSIEAKQIGFVEKLPPNQNYRNELHIKSQNGNCLFHI